MDFFGQLLLDYGVAVFVKVGFAELSVLGVLGISGVLEEFDDLLGGEVVSDVANLSSWDALHLSLILELVLTLAFLLIW